MTERLNWTAVGDAALLRLRGQGVSWNTLAGLLGVSRNAALARARVLQTLGSGRDEAAVQARHGARAGAPAERAVWKAAKPASGMAPGPVSDVEEEVREERAPLPPGHPLSWGLLTQGTCLEGEPYPYPVFA